MAKSKTAFFCKECGYETAKWMGQCPGCKSWDTLVEQPKAAKEPGRWSVSTATNTGLNRPKAKKLSQVESQESHRMTTGIGELDRVLGGGLVQGSLTLVGGDPGIGKSTLLLQCCRNMSKAGHLVLYVSGEESVSQIKMRAQRIGAASDNLLLISETNLDLIGQVVEEEKPEVIVIDSIQTMYRDEVGTAPGSVSQVREGTGVLLNMAKSQNRAIFIVGHVTKEGTVAGPRMLEHMVDTVLYFEGENLALYRILRGVKNRFGSTNEIGVFEMVQEGLREVQNPSEYMLSGKPKGEPGSIVTCSVEGTRPILVEVQALVCHTSFQLPRRTAAGTDYNRMNLLIAVIEKRMNLRLCDCDAYVNVAGGMKIKEPSLDLGIIAALISSFLNSPLPDDVLVFGEVGLTGEVRAVSHAGQRVLEAQKMGFRMCILPKANLKGLTKTEITLRPISNVRELLEFIRRP